MKLITVGMYENVPFELHQNKGLHGKWIFFYFLFLVSIFHSETQT